MAMKIVTSNGQTVQSFEDWKKGVNPSTSGQQTSNYSGPQIVTSSGQTVQSFEEWRQNRASGVTPGGDSAIMDWMDRYNRVMQGVSSYDKKRNGGFTQDASGGFGTEIESLIADYDGIEGYASEYGFRDAQKYLVQLKKLQNSIQGINDNFAQFEDEDAYNRYMDYWKDQEEKRSLDLDAYSREIADLERQLEEYDPQIDWTDTNQRKQYDAGLKQLEDEISRRKQYMAQAQRLQKKDAFSAVADPESDKYDAAFDSKSGYVSTEQDGKLERLLSQYSMGYDDLTYEYINNQNGIRDTIKQKAGAYKKGETPFEAKGYDYMTEDEVGLYNYYYSMGGKDSAQAYLDTIQEDLNQRKAAGMYQQMEGKTGAELVFGVEAGLDQFKGGIKGAVRAVKGDDSYVAPSATQYTSQMVREDLADDGAKLPSWLGGASLGQVGYDAITTTANMAPSIAVGMLNPAMGTAALGVSAGGSAYQEALNEGYSVDQARGYGILSGASEVVMERLLGGISAYGGNALGKFFTQNMKNADTALKRIAKEIGGSMLSEFSEEYLQEVLTPVFKNLTLGTDEEVKLVSAEALYAGFLGAITGGIMEGPSAIAGARNATADKTATVDNRLATEPIGNATDGGVTEEKSTPDGVTEQAAAVDDNLSATESTVGKTPGKNESSASKVGVSKMETVQLTKDIESFARQFGTQAEAVRRNYLEGQQKHEAENLQEYQVGFQAAFAIGLEGGKEEALGNVPYLSRSQREIAFSLGRDAAAAQKAAEAKAAAAKAPTTKASLGQTAQLVAEDGSKVGTVTIAEIVSMDDSGMTLRLEDGRTVTDEDLDFPEVAEVYSTVMELGMDAESANTIVRASAAASLSRATVAEAIETAYHHGQYGYGMDTLLKATEAAGIPEAVLKASYQAGENRRKQSRATAQVNKNRTDKQASEPERKGKVYFHGEADALNDVQKESLRELEWIADLTGAQIHVENMGDGEGLSRVNGLYDPADDSIHIDLRAGSDGTGTLLYTAAHEFVHRMRQNNEAAFYRLADFLVEQYGKKGVSTDALVKQQMADAANDGVELTYDEAFEEMVADAMEAMFTDTDALAKMEKLKAQDKSLWQEIKDFVLGLAEKIKAAYARLKPDSAEARYVLQMKESIDQMAQLFAEGVMVEKVETGTNGNSKVKYSFAGRSAATADRSALQQAEELERQGVDNETIRQQTGWYKGMDGQWRYEIDDSQMEITDDIINYMTLGELMQHEKLYAAYPDLADISVVFQGLEDGVNGSYHPQFDSINLSYQLKNDPVGLKDALVHEIQHAIQHREGFTSGATAASWERKIKAGFDSRRAEDIRKAQETEQELRRIQEEEPEFYRDMVELDAMTPDLPRGEIDWETLEKIEEDPIEWQQYDARREELEAKYGDTKVWDMNDLLYQREQAAKNLGRSGVELYFDTAGEIEARDASNRRSKTAQQRKSSPPRLGNEDTVFAEGNTVSHAMTEKEIAAVQKIGRVSVNSFTSQDIQATERLARRYWSEMGTKSPFFRAWFGDWRLNDRTSVQVATQKGDTRGVQHNKDTGWDIHVSGKVFNESRHRGPKNQAALPYLPYINDIVSKAVLLDSYGIGTGKEKSSNSLLMHSLYAVADIGNGAELLKLYVEEMNDPNAAETAKRAYQLQNIEKQQLGVQGSGNVPSPIRPAATIANVADLFAAVKQYDSDFKPNPPSKAASSDGTPLVVYHGTNARFNTFIAKSGAYWFSAYEDYAESMMEERGGGEIKACYLSMKNPYYAKLKPGQFSDPSHEAAILQAAKKGGHDGVIIENDTTNPLEEDCFYVVFDNKQIKSATDNMGTFDGSNPDIRYSRRKQTETEALREQNKKLQEDVDRLKELVKLQGKVTGGKIMKPSSVEAAAKYLKKMFHTGGDTKELAQKLNSLYEYIASDPELTWEGVKEQAAPIVQWLQDNEKFQRDQYAQDVLDTLKGQSFRLDETQLGEVKSQYGSLKEYRRAVKNMASSKANQSLDQLWQELSEQYPGIFSPDTSASDMPLAFAEAVERLEGMESTETAMDWRVKDQAMLEAVYDSYWRVSSLETVADKNARKENELKGKHYAQMDKLKRDWEYAARAADKVHKAAMEELRKEKNRQLKAHHDQQIKQNEASRKKARENREKTAMRKKIRRTVKALDTLLKSETKEKHVPDRLKKAVADALNLMNELDLGVTGKRLEAARASVREAEQKLLQAKESADSGLIADLQAQLDEKLATLQRYEKSGGRLTALKDAYEDIKNSTDPDISAGYDADVAGNLKELAETLQDTAFQDMSREQLQDVLDMYTMVLTRVRDANKQLGARRGETLKENAAEAEADIRKLGRINNEDRGLIGNAVTKWVRSFSWNNLRPVDAFHRLGSRKLEQLYMDVVDGMAQRGRQIREIGQFITDIRKKTGYKGFDLKEAQTYTTVDGKKMKLTLAEKMSIYAYSKRAQAFDHMTEGGFTYARNLTYKEDGKIKVHTEKAETWRLSLEDLQAICSSLTAQQRQYVDAVQQFLTEFGRHGDKVNMELYGIKLFNKENAYFPLDSDRDYRKSVETQLGGTMTAASLKNDGMTKKTVPGANNPIVLEDFDRVVFTHLDKMVNYANLVLPLENLRRVFDYQTAASEEAAPMSMKALIQGAFGTEAEAYINQFLTDANGTRMGMSINPLETMFARSKGMAVSANLSVMIQQVSAVVRAAAEIAPQHLVWAAENRKGVKLYDEMVEYAPIAVIKDMGGFDTGSNRSIEEYIGFEEAPNSARKAWNSAQKLFGKGAETMDKVGWCIIWNGVKREVASRKQYQVNSEDFLQACGRRFTEVIVKTQVYDSVLSRSGYMRDKHGTMRYLTSFMGEPTVQAGMVFTSHLDVVRAVQQKKDVGYHVKRLLRTDAALIGALVVNGMLKAIPYAMRDDDEDEGYWERWAKHFGSAVSELWKPWELLPILRNIDDIVQGYSVTQPDMALLEGLLQAGMRTYNVLTDEETLGEMTPEDWYGLAKDLSGALGNFVGIPAENIWRDLEGVARVFKDMTDGIDSDGKLLDALKRGMSGKEKTKHEGIYDALVSGDTARQEALRATYKTDGSYQAAVRKALRLHDPRIKEMANARYEDDYDRLEALSLEIEAEGIFDMAAIRAAYEAERKAQGKERGIILEEDAEAEPETESTVFSMEEYYAAIRGGSKNSIQTAYDALLEEKKQEYYLTHEAESSIQSSVTSKVKGEYLDEDISKKDAISILTEYGGKSKDKAQTEIKKWEFQMEYHYAWGSRDRCYRSGTISRGALEKAVRDIEGATAQEAKEYVDFLELEMANDTVDITASEASGHFEHAKPNGISVEVYLDYKARTNGIQNDKDADGNTIRYSAVKKIMGVIDSLPISDYQKTALARSQGWSEKTIQEYKKW